MNRKKIICRLCIVIVTILFSVTEIKAQRHFYHRIDLGSGNLYTFVGENIIAAYGNYLTHDMLFDTSYMVNITNGRYDATKIKTRILSPIDLTAREAFNDISTGVKLGWQSDLAGSVNWGAFGSVHYRLNQFETKFPFSDAYNNERFQYAKFGGGILLIFGSYESKTKVQLEAAIRYDMPIAYKGIFGNNKKILNSGVSSHYSVKVAGFSWISAGVYFDYNHYDSYKNWDKDDKLKMYNVGAIFTITPKRGEDAR